MSGLIRARPLLKGLSPKERGAVGGGSGNDTLQMQRTINECAAKGIPFCTDGDNYAISQLVLPSGLIWDASNTTLTQIAASNCCALKNGNESFGARADKNIQIRGRLFIDCSGANQSDTEVGGVLTVGVRFTGVDGLRLDVTLSNPRRYGFFVVNCKNVTGDPTIKHNPAIPSLNKDGFHVNGNSSEIRLGTLTVENGEDDALALNADDVDHGGNWTKANLSGQISNVSVDKVIVKNCRQGLRLLSAANSISNIYIGAIAGDVSVYAFNAQDYDLGASSWYKNIRVGSISVDFKDNPGASTMGLINIRTTKPNGAELSDFSFGNIDRGQVGTVGTERETMQFNLKRTLVSVDRLYERYCSNASSIKFLGAASGSEFHIREYQRTNSVQRAGLWGCAISLADVALLDILKIGTVNCDYLRNLVVATNSIVREAHIGTWPVTTGSVPLYFNGTTEIKALFLHEPNAAIFKAKSRYQVADTAKVSQEWPAYKSGITSDRPTTPAPGDCFYDVSLAKPIWWSEVTGKWGLSDGTVA